MELKLCVYLFLGIYVGLAAGDSDPCEAKETCSQCITYSNCVWCAKVGIGKHCVTDSDEIQSKCKGDLDEINSKIEYTKNDSFISNDKIVIQLKPQKIKIDLRVGQPTNFKFTFKQAHDYPVDLYFLLDASHSMEQVRKTLMNQTKTIHEIMTKFTKQIRLGIGTFVDKNAFPYVTDPGKKNVYSFKNHLSLTKDVKKFYDTLNSTKHVTNFDMPESGLDALAQVLACSEGDKNIVNWNKHTRKFVLIFTDAQFHVAGDGHLAGIHQPYDGECYTTNEGIYSKELEMDYPTVSMIYKLAKKMEASLIFIVEDKIYDIYDSLSYYLGGIVKSYDGSESDFIKNLREAYVEQTKSVQLKTRIPGMISLDDLIIKFSPNCTVDSREPACKIQDNKEIDITGTITLKTYYEASNAFQVDIVVNGINEKLQLDVNVITKCNCEDKRMMKAPECEGHGDLVCGLCECNKGWYGPKCKFDKPEDITQDSAMCKNPNDGQTCSGNGKCEYGECKCYSSKGVKEYTGSFCQCNNHGCKIGPNGKQCSDRGKCECGRCLCGEWKGDACDISPLKTNCMENDKECNGLGTCFNNTCECKKPPEWDARQTYDEKCVVLNETDLNQCKLLEKHAICAHDKESSCPDKDSVKVNLTQDIISTEDSWKICKDVRVGPGCYIQFGYKYDNRERTVQLLVDETANCQGNYYLYGGIVFGTLVLVGICTLAAWKILTTIRDRKEYEQFLLSSNNRQSSVRKNVLYTSPKTTVDNPTYENKCE